MQKSGIVQAKSDKCVGANINYNILYYCTVLNINKIKSALFFKFNISF